MKFSILLPPTQVLQQLRQARQTPAGLLRNHRPLDCNADDYLRMAAVPVAARCNFRDWPGVVTNNDGSCCAGQPGFN